MNKFKSILMSSLLLLTISMSAKALVVSSQNQSSCEYLAGDIYLEQPVDYQKSQFENINTPSKKCVWDFFSDNAISHPKNTVYLPETQQDTFISSIKTVSGRSYFISPDPLGIDGGVNVYAYANLNPLFFVDPYGLCGESFGSRVWNATKGIGILAAGFVPYLGDAMDVYDVAAPRSSGATRTIGVASLGVNIWTAGLAPNAGPIMRGAGMVGDAIRGTAKSPIRRFDVGSFNDLKRLSRTGDALDIHHVGQKHVMSQVVDGYNPRTAPSIAIPVNQHRLIPTVQGNYGGSARDILATDIRNLRSYTDAPNSSLQNLIQLNRQQYPSVFNR